MTVRDKKKQKRENIKLFFAMCLIVISLVIGLDSGVFVAYLNLLAAQIEANFTPSF